MSSTNLQNCCFIFSGLDEDSLGMDSSYCRDTDPQDWSVCNHPCTFRVYVSHISQSCCVLNFRRSFWYSQILCMIFYYISVHEKDKSGTKDTVN